MSRVNWPRVVQGGLVAGVVMNVMDAVTNGILLLGQYEANSIRLGLNPKAAQSLSGLVTLASLDFVFGIVLVWMYAAARPRYGPGPLTAIRVALALYLGTMGIIVGFALMGVLTPSLLIAMAVAGLMTLVAGSLVGGWLYREGP